MTWHAHQLGFTPELQDLATLDIASVPPAPCPRGSGTRPAAPPDRAAGHPLTRRLLDWLLAPLGPESRHGHLAQASIDAAIAEHLDPKETHDQAAVAAARDAALPGARRASASSRKLELTGPCRLPGCREPGSDRGFCGLAHEERWHDHRRDAEQEEQ